MYTVTDMALHQQPSSLLLLPDIVIVIERQFLPVMHVLHACPVGPKVALCLSCLLVCLFVHLHSCTQ